MSALLASARRVYLQNNCISFKQIVKSIMPSMTSLQILSNSIIIDANYSTKLMEYSSIWYYVIVAPAYREHYIF
jgi:hypothetical protein